MLLASYVKTVIKDLKKQLKGKFEITNLGPTQRMLRIEISHYMKMKTLKLTKKKGMLIRF